MNIRTKRPAADQSVGRVLVTTGNGNVGREVVRLLRARGVSMRVAGRAAIQEKSPAALVPMPDAANVELDFTRPETFDEALRGCDTVFLVRPPPIANVRVTLNRFIDRAVVCGVRHVVFVSVAG